MPARKGTLFFDGASKGNPGPSGAGAVLLLDGRRIPMARALPFMATNNVAEYAGLIEGLRLARAHGVTHLEVVGDSELVVRHMTGRYRVSKDHLRLLHGEATRLAAAFPQVTWRSVPRAENADADAQANSAANEAALRRADLTPYDRWVASLADRGQTSLPES